MAQPIHTIDTPVPERRGLEASFVRVRWLAAAAIAILTPLGGFHPLASLSAVVVLIAGNLVVLYLNQHAATLTSQRRLGVAATTLDALVVFGLSLAAPDAAVNAVYGALLVVVAETAMRFAPVKALAGAGILIAGLALTMALRSAITGEAFDLQLLAVSGVLVLLAGTMIGSVVREIYRQRVAPSGGGEEQTPAVGSGPSVPEDALALLTPRERQVMSLIGQGYSNAQIAAALVVEQKTVKNHINNIYGKLRLNSRYEAITHMLGQRRANAEDGAALDP
ncbi:MAG: helix-turn-helix transcriptional regulator [Dehalococcoidia bacterium]